MFSVPTIVFDHSVRRNCSESHPEMVQSTSKAIVRHAVSGGSMQKRSVSYNSDVVQDLANRLYEQANWTPLSLSFQGLVVGVFLGIVLGGGALSFSGRDPVSQLSSMITGSLGAVWISIISLGLLGAWSGYSRGRIKAFDLRLRAQEALCQVQIEKNCRSPTVTQST